MLKREWDKDPAEGCLYIDIDGTLINLYKGNEKPYVIDDEDTPDYEGSPYYAEIDFEGGHYEEFSERNGQATSLMKVIDNIRSYFFVKRPTEEQLEWLWTV